MSQISLGDIPSGDMRAGSGVGENGCPDILALLVGSIGKHAVAEDGDELQRFQERIAAEMERLKAADQVRSAVESVIQLMAHTMRLF